MDFNTPAERFKRLFFHKQRKINLFKQYFCRKKKHDCQTFIERHYFKLVFYTGIKRIDLSEESIFGRGKALTVTICIVQTIS